MLDQNTEIGQKWSFATKRLDVASGAIKETGLGTFNIRPYSKDDVERFFMASSCVAGICAPACDAFLSTIP